MTKKFLWGVIVLLLITNLATIVIWMKEKEEVITGENTPQLKRNDTVASIGNTDISYEKWLTTLEDTYGKKVLKDMVDREVVLQLAKKNGIEINEKLIEREISLLYTMEGPLTKQEAKAKEEAWRSDVRYRYYLEALLTMDIAVSEEEIREYFETYEDQFQFEASYQFSQIVVNDMETASKIMRELDDGASFSVLAREYSIDQKTKDDGGYLGFFTNGTNFLEDIYFEEADEMENNSYSKPIQTGDGVVVFYLHRKVPSVRFTYDELKGEIRREVALERLNQVANANSLWDKLDVEWIYGK
ncbi:peptidyl-prolyl cis-trans isomerase [Aquibacillus sp. 3ASR75-11]|uniref:peptidylprolyl isomerase n=1 Tax=Terrihalobacillus insolitus TaxID=2950438 RepID=A0A9X4AN84_9BACI|nr:peptidyl-prolyl cis-trans isomerase [Terrihalobacillus insolitus]MDC3426247.1 peptidyl-prolyl cis-trans isomerase [Terrihalobacillus insolitus]